MQVKLSWFVLVLPLVVELLLVLGFAAFPCGGSFLGAKMRFVDGSNVCALNYDGDRLNTNCALGHGF